MEIICELNLQNNVWPPFQCGRELIDKSPPASQSKNEWKLNLEKNGDCLQWKNQSQSRINFQCFELQIENIQTIEKEND